MCVWNDIKIEKWAKSGGIRDFIETDIFGAPLIQPASIDLCWGGVAMIDTDDGMAGLNGGEPMHELVVHPGKFYLLNTREYLTIPSNACGTVMVKSTPGRKGLNHVMSAFFDPGFYGEATLEIFNVSSRPITIMRGQAIVQLKIEDMVANPRQTYAGRYNGQTGAQEAR